MIAEAFAQCGGEFDEPTNVEVQVGEAWSREITAGGGFIGYPTYGAPAAGYDHVMVSGASCEIAHITPSNVAMWPGGPISNGAGLSYDVNAVASYLYSCGETCAGQAVASWVSNIATSGYFTSAADLGLWQVTCSASVQKGTIVSDGEVCVRGAGCGFFDGLGFSCRGTPEERTVSFDITATNLRAMLSAGPEDLGHIPIDWSAPTVLRKLQVLGNDPDGGALGHWEVMGATGPGGRSLNDFDFVQPDSNQPDLRVIQVQIHEADIGRWTLQLGLGDDEGELTETPLAFVIENARPEFQIPLLGEVYMDTDPIEVWVEDVEDPDGGTPSITWEIKARPNSNNSGGAIPPAPTDLDPDDRVFAFRTTSHLDFGDWEIEVTVTDDEPVVTVGGNASDIDEEVSRKSKKHTFKFKVKNRRPDVDVSPAPGKPWKQVKLGEPISLDASASTDPDGGQVTVDWDLGAGPTGGAAAVGSTHSGNTWLLSKSSSSPSRAGHYVFGVCVADDEEPAECEAELIFVKVDAEPVVEVTGQVTYFGEGPLEFSGTATDPDTDNPHSQYPSWAPENRGKGVIRAQWMVDFGPESEAGPLQDIFHDASLSGSGSAANPSAVSIPANELKAGRWGFVLEVEDDEGNTTRSDAHVVEVILPEMPPVAVIDGIQEGSRFALQPTGTAGGGILSDALSVSSDSFDPDNVNPDGTSPTGGNVGIYDFDWRVDAPPTCVGYEAAAPSPDGASLTVLPVGPELPAECQGTWSVSLIVTDDEGEMSASTRRFVLGSCDAGICIDIPSTDAPVYVEYTDQFAVGVSYRLDAALYDDPLWSSLVPVVLSIYPNVPLAPGNTEPFYLIDATVRPEDGPLPRSFVWRGVHPLGRPAPGLYGISATFLDIVGFLAPIADEPNSIWLDVSGVFLKDGQPDSIAVRVDELDDGTPSINLDYWVHSTTPPKRVELVISSANGTEWVIPMSTHEAGRASWDGVLPQGAGNVEPGFYGVRVRAYGVGEVLLGATEQVELLVYQLRVKPNATSPSGKPWLVAFANLDDDDADGRRDIDLSPRAATDDEVVELAVQLEPESLAGTIEIHAIPSSCALLVPEPGSSASPDSQPWMPGQSRWLETSDVCDGPLQLRLTRSDGGTLLGSIVRLVGVLSGFVSNSFEGVGAPLLTYVQIGRLESAYFTTTEMLPNGVPYYSWNLKLQPSNNFVDFDDSSFRISFRFPLAISGDSSDSIPVPTSTDSCFKTRTPLASAAIDDCEEESTPMLEWGAAEEYRSKAQLLVNPDLPTNPDDAIVTYEMDSNDQNPTPIAVPDNTPGDQTHKASVHGSMSYQLRFSSEPDSVWPHAVIPVCERLPESRRVVTIRGRLAASSVLPAEVLATEFDKMIERANIALSPACIVVKKLGVLTKSDATAVDGPFNAANIGHLTNALSTTNPEFTTVDVWFFDQLDLIEDIETTLGFAISREYAVQKLGVAFGDRGKVLVLRSDVEPRSQTLVHELLHLLANSGHVDGGLGALDNFADKGNPFILRSGKLRPIDVYGELSDETPASTRRLSHATIHRARAVWADGSMETSPGSKLLTALPPNSTP